jgi:thiamine-phosphate pyrophosphorylase
MHLFCYEWAARMHSSAHGGLPRPVTSWLQGFYAVLDRDDEALAEQLVSPSGVGARVLQVRIKPDTPVSALELLRVGQMARQICDRHGAALVINDRLDLALACGADAVHLGQTDLPLAAARAALVAAGRAGRLAIGVSTHTLEQVAAAVAGGADYLGFGPVFATTTKANPDPVVGLAGLAAAVRAAGSVPVVAIGGMTAAVADAVYATGAAAICAISSVNGAADVAAAGRAMGRR